MTQTIYRRLLQIHHQNKSSDLYFCNYFLFYSENIKTNLKFEITLLVSLTTFATKMSFYLITFYIDARNNTLMILDGGIHAREWISPAFCMYVIQMLVEYRTEHLDMLKNTDWLIVPLVNPDGYEYTHTTVSYH